MTPEALQFELAARLHQLHPAHAVEVRIIPDVFRPDRDPETIVATVGRYTFGRTFDSGEDMGRALSRYENVFEAVARSFDGKGIPR